MNQLLADIRELTSLDGPCSREDRIIDYMAARLRRYDDQLTIDRLGNITCRIGPGHAGARKLMIFAHMDEIGLIVRKVEANGFLRFERIGGVHVNTLPGLRVNVLGRKGTVSGIIGIKSHHFTKPAEKGVVPGIDDLYVDIGAASREEVLEAGVDVGTMIVYRPEFTQLKGGLVANKAMDNRAACAVLLALAEALHAKKDELQWDVYLVACVQEEFNIRGILPASRRILPDASIGIDVTPSCDTPDLRGYSDVVIGKGPALTMMNFHGRGTLAGVLPDEKLLNRLLEVAEQASIPHQKEIALGVITENAYISLQGDGIPVAGVSIPTRYTHTPIETVSLHDVERLTLLLLKFAFDLKDGDQFGKGFADC
jgi:putative aminopeptidase FrvX